MPTSEEARDWLAHYLADDELAHHGVLGMKWGVRKDRPSGAVRSSISSSAKPKTTPKSVKVSTTENTEISKGDLITLGAAGVGTIAYAGYAFPELRGAVGAPFFVSTIKKDVLDIAKNTAAIDHAKDFLRDKADTNISMGTTFHRVASYKETEINAAKYATYLRDDVLRYRQTWITPGRSSNAAHFVTKMQATKNITIASPDTILKTITRDLHLDLGDGKSLYSEFMRVGNKYYGYSATDSVDDIARAIVQHNRLAIWADDVGVATANIMKKAGFAAVTDINNTGSMARKHAVIILDSAAFKVTSRRLTSFERSAAGLVRSSIARAAAKKAAGAVI